LTHDYHELAKDNFSWTLIYNGYWL
jgi:hypothetical protein